ncbi:MAG: hypothetical protein LBH43_01110, partial [Treponema sp.]|nr:hypothetical protein [Treponema sp.]
LLAIIADKWGKWQLQMRREKFAQKPIINQKRRGVSRLFEQCPYLNPVRLARNSKLNAYGVQPQSPTNGLKTPL